MRYYKIVKGLPVKISKCTYLLSDRLKGCYIEVVDPTWKERLVVAARLGSMAFMFGLVIYLCLRAV